MAKATVLYLSFNPSYYDAKKLADLSYDEAKTFIENDKIGALSDMEEELDLTKSGIYQYTPNGMRYRDTSDSLIIWIKVCGD